MHIMPEFKRFFQTVGEELPSCAIFMSGNGTNAEKIIENAINSENANFTIKVLVTDRPKSSNTKALADKYKLPIVAVGLKNFYRENGLESTSLATKEGKRIRTLWTQQLLTELNPYKIDFGLLAGFEPLCNIMVAFPCLNIHPGDLTYTKDQKRVLVGLHTLPVEKAILEGHNFLRSSVILAEPFLDKGDNMDAGHILGICDKVNINFMGHALEELEACYFSRPEIKPKNGFDDSLEKVAKYNLQQLKEKGDWVLFSKVINDFASQRFCEDKDGEFYYCLPNPIPVTTVLYGTGFKEIIFSLD